ncbi:hypothetical protein CONPUDRAFT_152613 [Coniophora puteana RWD-64-598 SS2]|uniref:Uncharacterized protein n=1 Tax=Coniophora puteana (strain RWD-64-598) TaxID=741705 RepID=A0A5M3MSQ9_CONPW|nr:uncharacterized protein CONPUDRAFT_152613 [Coniophora puteana RWD-64-598 SS2]EIW81695.1 hypothetical protein CONPUDRAFT_152613 [Coniophora puteana RWD-64-598 SS2]
MGQDARWGVPVDGRLDSAAHPDNHRIEALAVLVALSMIGTVIKKGSACGKSKARKNGKTPPLSWIVATDSQYVVDRITDTIKARCNQDVFKRISLELQKLEVKYGSKIQFWLIKRAQNHTADLLARGAAKMSMQGV